MKRPEHKFGQDLPPPQQERHLQVKKGAPTTDNKKEWRKENKKRLQDAVTYRVTLPPGYDLAAEQKRSETKSGRPKHSEPSRRGGITIDVDDSHNRFICDSAGYIGAMVMPHYLGADMLSKVTHNSIALGQSSCAAFMLRESDKLRAKDKRTTQKVILAWRSKAISFIKGKLAKFGKSDRSPEKMRLLADLKTKKNPLPPSAWAGRWIKAPDGDQYQPINTFGMLHLVKAWHPIGHQYVKPALPSVDCMGNATIEQLSTRFQFMDAMSALDYRIDHLLELAYPEFYQLISAIHPEVEKTPLIHALKHVWHTRFLGRAVLFNKLSAQHLDVSGVHRGWDILVACGEFEGGDLYLKDMNVRIPFRPGTLIAFDGTAQRHEIEGFTGAQRISHVYFVHDSVFREHKIATNTLPDLHVSDLAERLSTLSPGQQNAKLPKRKRN